MTVSTQVSRNEYTGNGATTQYDFTFRILDKSNLLVQTLDASENITTLVLGADYTVTGVNRYPGGKVVLSTALPDGYKISIERSTPVTQETSIRNQGGFFPEIHEDAFDKLTMLIQQTFSWWSGLALKKPSWLANYYDAQNNRIRNLRDPSQAQDAATKNYVDVEVAAEAAERQAADNNLQSQISVNLQRTLRVPESYVDVLPSVAARRNSLLGWNNSGKPVPIFSMTETADLAIKLASSDEGLGGDLVADTEYFSVRDVLSRIRTLSDIGGPLPYLGYDPVNDAALYNAMGGASDRHLLLNGGLHIAGDCTNGIRRNAGLFSVRGGQEDSGQGFNIPLMGVSNARGLRGYGIYELVSSYIDITTPERQSYHNVATATYTATTATIDPTTYAETLAKLKVGHYIRTMHPTYCVGLVTAINATTGVITVDEWADSGTTTTTPANGVGLYTRYITKAYAANINLFITENSDVTNASGVELGMSAHKLVSGTVAGLDIPVLSSSTQNMTVGLLVRAATKNGTGLDFSVRASDARVNFHSDGTDGIGRTVRVGFNESSNAITGFRGNGRNTSYLMLASTVTDITDTSLENSPMILGPYGQDYRKYDRVITISSDTTLNGYFPNVTLTAAGITITFPPAAAHRSGHYYYFNLRTAGDYFFKGDVPVEGNTPYKVTTTVVRKTIKIQYDGSQWLVYGDK